MASVSGVWAIDIGSNALKALHLVPGAEGLEVVGFDYIEHARILSAGGIDGEVRNRVIGETLHEFASRNDISKDEVAISIAGQNSFARFIKLPPVEKKRIPEIVQLSRSADPSPTSTRSNGTGRLWKTRTARTRKWVSSPSRMKSSTPLWTTSPARA